MAKTSKDGSIGRKGQSNVIGETASMSQKMEAIRELLLRLDREKLSIIDERLSILEEYSSNDSEFSDRLANQLLVALKKMNADGGKKLAECLAKILDEDVKDKIKNAEPQIRQALLPNFGAFIGQGVRSEFRKLSLHILGFFQGVETNRLKTIENRTEQDSALAEKAEENLHSTRYLRHWWQNFWFLGTTVLMIALLIWGGSTIISNVWQASLIARAQAAIAKQPELAAYPFSFEMYPGNRIMRVTGLLSDTSQFALLDEVLIKELPNMHFDKNVRTIFDDTVMPKLDRFTFAVETNSQNIHSLGEELSVQRKLVQEMEQAFVRTDRTIGLLRAMEPNAPNFYISKPLAVLRTDIEALMSTPGSAQTQFFGSDSIEQLVGGLTVAFTERAEIIDPPRTFRVGQVLEAALKGSNKKRQVNVVAVVKTSNDEVPSAASKRGQVMLRQVMRILLANGVERENLTVSVMFEDPMSPRSELLDGVSEDSWLHNSFVGLSFAD